MTAVVTDLIIGAVLFLAGGAALIVSELRGVFDAEPGDTITEILESWRKNMPAAFWAVVVSIGALGVGAPVLIWHLLAS